MIYIQLFLSFIQVGALSFGGGYAAMPLIQAQVIDTGTGGESAQLAFNERIYESDNDR